MVFKVSSNNFYRCHPTGPSNQVMEHSLFKDLIQKKFELNKQRYGSTRIAEQLKRKGYCISRCRVAKIMKVNHWVSKHKRKFKATTDSHHNYPVCRNLLNRNFTPGRLNAAWISDITWNTFSSTHLVRFYKTAFSISFFPLGKRWYNLAFFSPVAFARSCKIKALYPLDWKTSVNPENTSLFSVFCSLIL